jgi:hypothetical protein
MSKSSIILALTAIAFSGCRSSNKSAPKDTFVNDHETRRPLTPEESRWIVNLGNMTAIPLTGNLLLTNDHVAGVARQGYALNEKRTPFAIVRTLEFSPVEEMDYALVEVYWAGGKPPAELAYIDKLMMTDQLTYGQDGQGTLLETFGFPSDRGGEPTYATGYAKEFVNDEQFKGFIFHNMGAATGNSGSPIFPAGSKVLAGMNSGGPHSPDQPQFSNNDLEDYYAWNWGPAAFEMYKRSQVLQSIFDASGDNRFVNSDNTLYIDGNCATDSYGQSYTCWEEDLAGIWQDSSGRGWRLSGAKANRRAYELAAEECGDGFRLPTLEEFTLAYNDGLLNPEQNRMFGYTVKVFKDRFFWLASDGSGEPFVKTSDDSAPTQDMANGPKEYAAICISH